MKDYIKYIIGTIVGVTVFTFGVLFAKKHMKKTYSKQPDREYMVWERKGWCPFFFYFKERSKSIKAWTWITKKPYHKPIRFMIQLNIMNLEQV